MTTKNQKTNLRKKDSTSASSPLSRPSVRKKTKTHKTLGNNIFTRLRGHTTFAAFRNFYSYLIKFISAILAKQLIAINRGKHFLNTRRIAIMGISVITITGLLCILLKLSSQLSGCSIFTEQDDTTNIKPPVIANNQIITAKQTQTNSHIEYIPYKPSHQIAEHKPSREASSCTASKDKKVLSTQALSLEAANLLYLRGDYKKAYKVYDQLYRNLAISEEELIGEFFQLRKALCMKKVGDLEQADYLFKAVSHSCSPIIAVIANYYCSLLEMEKKQYLNARSRAYQVIALIETVNLNKEWVLSLLRECYFLIAESITKHFLSLCDADKDIPAQLWSSKLEIDPFTNLNKTQLRSLLNSGREQLNEGLYGPQIQKLKHQSHSPRWSVVCCKTPVGQLLARFAANAGFDIRWILYQMPDSGQPTDAVRNRTVTLYLPDVSAQQFLVTVAGCAGLLARFESNKTVNIFNPENYFSLSDYISLLSEEAISLWRRFLLTFYDDERVPNAHFALGVVHAQKSCLNESIAEYRLIADRFPQSPLAPFALLYSSQLKATLHDYAGAREDLQQMVEQYPNSGIISQAYLYLADVTLKAGFYDEAGRLYRKVYNLGLSVKSQIASAFGAGKCFYQKGDYQAAIQWLTRYIALAQPAADKGLYSAYLLLGKANLALGEIAQAGDAFQRALKGELSKQEYMEAISALVETQMRQGDFVKALETLESVESWWFSQKEFIELVLLKSKVLRAMGLSNKAMTLLGDQIEYIIDPQIKAKVSLELAKCYTAEGDLSLACSNLTKILMLVEPGQLAEKIAIELADVCLKLGKNYQAISICQQLLSSAASAETKQKALCLLASAYFQQENYDRAVLALLGKWQAKNSSDKDMVVGKSSSFTQTPN